MYTPSDFFLNFIFYKKMQLAGSIEEWAGMNI